ncbi:MAG: hypothetical protein AB7U41_01320 [Dongiaceae bacterium]
MSGEHRFTADQIAAIRRIGEKGFTAAGQATEEYLGLCEDASNDQGGKALAALTTFKEQLPQRFAKLDPLALQYTRARLDDVDAMYGRATHQRGGR